MLFTVVIPTYHRNDLLRLCLESLAPNKQSLDNKYYEVIVTDDGKNTTAEAMIKKDFSWVQWVKGPQKGPASNRNFGAKNAKNGWLVFIDDDCVPDRELLSNYKKIIQLKKEIKVFEGKIKADREKQRFDEESPVNLYGGYLWSCNFAIEKKFFEQLGGFDENFPSAAMEDVDLRERIYNKNTEIYFNENAVVIHPFRKKAPLSKIKYRMQSIIYFNKKHNKHKNVFSLKVSFEVYVRKLFKVVKKMFRFKFQGIYYILKLIHLSLFYKIKYRVFKKI